MVDDNVEVAGILPGKMNGLVLGFGASFHDVGGYERESIDGGRWKWRTRFTHEKIRVMNK